MNIYGALACLLSIPTIISSVHSESRAVSREPLLEADDPVGCYRDQLEGDQVCKGDNLCVCYYPSGNFETMGVGHTGEVKECKEKYPDAYESCESGGSTTTDVTNSISTIDMACNDSGLTAANAYQARCKEGYEYYGGRETVGDQKSGDCCTRTVSYLCCPAK